jgi:hypothetical protein
MVAILHSLNFMGGWSLILAGFLVGAAVGLGLCRDDFLGGYTSFRRRLIRLGHIALIALGMLNVLFAVAAPAGGPAIRVASALLIAGALAMPTVCFLTAWKSSTRHLFFIPVLCLVVAVILILIGGPP